MPDIGPLELIIVLVIALLVFGPKRLPSLGRQLGTGMREFRDSITGRDRKDDEPEAEPAPRRDALPAAPDAPKAPVASEGEPGAVRAGSAPRED